MTIKIGIKIDFFKCQFDTMIWLLHNLIIKKISIIFP